MSRHDGSRYMIHWQNPDRKVQGAMANIPFRDLKEALKEATGWAYGRDAVKELSGYHWRRSADWAANQLEQGSDGEFGRVTVIYAPDDWPEF